MPASTCQVSQSGSFLSLLGRVLLLAVAYYMAGWLGLLLAIPPGQATAIWPPSGIALAGLLLCGYRCWPGVFIGAFAKSLIVPDVVDQAALVQAGLVSAGATLQALAGAWLVRRMAGFPSRMERPGEIISLLFWGGCVACVINASVGTFVLHSAGYVPKASVVQHWMVWWIGDVLGVVVFTPIVLLLLSYQNRLLEISKTRRFSVALSIMGVFLLVTYLFVQTSDHYKKIRSDDFYNRARSVAEKFQKDLIINTNVLIANDSFFAASEYVSADEFARFTRRFLEKSNSLFGLAWLPRVERDERAAFEQKIRAQGFPDFEIRRRFEYGRMGRSEERDLYFPITYIAPYERNKLAHGLDVHGVDPLGDNIRLKALNAARDEGVGKATARFPIVQAEDQYGFIIYHPVYDKAMDGQSVAARRKNHIGYLNGIFVLPEMMRSVEQEARKGGCDLVVFDNDAPPELRLLFDSRTPDKKEGLPESYDFSNAGLLSFSFPIEMAGRDWDLVFVENKALQKQGLEWGLWALLVGGLFYTGLFSIFMLVISARTAVVEREVGQKTAALQEANTELEEFAYRTSHDLRSPIISSLSLLSLAQDSIRQKDYKTVNESLRLATKSLQQLNNLIEDILQLTEIRNIDEKPEPVDIGRLLDETLAKLSHLSNFNRIDFRRNLKFSQSLVVKPLRMRMILENLISNAIKYQDPEKDKSLVRISTYEQDGSFVLEVMDNGLGVPRKYQGELFQMFKRFHPKVAFGSGLGLYLIQKSTAVLGGRIEFIDPGEGALFRVTIPLKSSSSAQDNKADGEG